MDSKEFREDFLEDIKAEAEISGEGSTASFVNSFADYLTESELLVDFVPAYFEGTGKNNKKIRVDGYAYDDELTKTLSLVIADYDISENIVTLTKTKVKQLQSKLVAFLENALNFPHYLEMDMSRSCSDLVDLLREERNKIRKYQFFIFTTAPISQAISTIESSDIDGIPSECQIWDIDRLFKVCGSDTGRNIIEINFKEYSGKGIPCMEASNTETEDFKSYLCVMPGTLLANIYDKYGSSLLEGNVRSFLSTKVAVNKKIRKTILNSPERFFAYNNGISVTAMDVQIENNFLVSAKDFQIINGGQTTASLSSARFKYKDKVNLDLIYVQMKLTVIEHTSEQDATELVQNISRSSNSQNKVSDADFFSTHPFHVRMERFSQRLYARAVNGAQHETRWFYERARGQYLQKQMRMTPGEKKKFLLQNPKRQLITKTDLAKVQNTWQEIPHIVSKGSQKSFSVFADTIGNNWDASNNGSVYNEKYFKESVALVLLFRYSEVLVSNQPWYANGYRANIVTYTIALLHYLIKKQFEGMDLDLMKIWMQQSIPEAVEMSLTELSKQVYYKLTDPTRQVENVTQWCKREACWENVKSINYILPLGIKENLISIEEQKIAVQQAKKTQRIDSDLEIQTKVITITKTQWQSVLNFADSKHMLTTEEKVALRIASKPGKVPNSIQCKKLISLLDRLQLEGFKL